MISKLIVRVLAVVGVIIITQGSLYAQALPDSVAKFVHGMHLRPLKQVDTISKKIPSDFVTASGWHVAYYASITQSDMAQIDAYRVIYKGNIFYCSASFMAVGHTNYKYDSLKLVNETSRFLFFTVMEQPGLGDNMLLIPKINNEQGFQFTNLISKDFTHGIFIEFDDAYDKSANIPYLRITNINTHKVKELKFENTCEGGKNNWCIESVTYLNGELTITANLAERHSHKPVKEVKSVKI